MRCWGRHSYTFKLALDKSVAEAGDMTEEQREEHRMLLRQAKVQETLFGPLEGNGESKRDRVLSRERKRAVR